MKWRVSTTEAEARPHPAPAADVKNRADGTGAAPRHPHRAVLPPFPPRQQMRKTVQTAPAQPPAESPAAYGLIFFRGKPMSNMGEKHKGRGKAGKLSVVPILWEPQAETDVSTPHLRG